MSKHIATISLLFSMLLLSSPGANAADVKADYFHGKWEVDGGPTCGAKKDVEYIVFNNNGTFEDGRGSRAEMVGFWRLEGEVLYLDTVASPGAFQHIAPQLKTFENQFGYYPMKAMVVNPDKDQFTAVVLLENEMTRLSVRRCK